MAVKMSLAEHLIAAEVSSVLPNLVVLRSVARGVKDDLKPARAVLILCA